MKAPARPQVTTYKVHVVRQPAASGRAAEDDPLAGAQQLPTFPSCRAPAVGAPRELVASSRHAQSCPSLDR